MAARWPEFRFRQFDDSLVGWEGPLRGFQKQYRIEALWIPTSTAKPYVVLRDPSLRPREGKRFDEIPHTLFHAERPEFSGLCLFDPEGEEWSNKQLIADTTIAWSAEWLLYYELWHLEGVWRGGGVGPENAAEARAAALYQTSNKLADYPSGATSLACG